MCHVLMINFLMIMEKAVYTLGLITLQDQKIKSNNYHFLCVGRLINILGGASFVDLLCFCSVLCLLCFVRVCLCVLRGRLLGGG